MITRSKAGIFKPKVLTVSTPMCNLYDEPKSVQQALSIPAWKDAMESEFQALMKNNTWVLVPYSSIMNLVTNKWVFRVKYKADGFVERHKARLVVRGFQQTTGLDYFETFSPVIKPATIRVVFTLAVSFNWPIQ